MKSSYGPELLPKKVSQRKKLEVRGGLFDLYGGGGVEDLRKKFPAKPLQ